MGSHTTSERKRGEESGHHSVFVFSRRETRREQEAE
jgi:hypothetical protein